MKYHIDNRGWDRVQPKHITALLEPYGSLDHCREKVIRILEPLVSSGRALTTAKVGKLVGVLNEQPTYPHMSVLCDGKPVSKERSGDGTIQPRTTVEFNGLADVTLITPTSKTRIRFTAGAIDIDFGAGGHTRCAALREKFPDFPGEFEETPTLDVVWPTPTLPFEDGPPLEVVRKKRGTP